MRKPRIVLLLVAAVLLSSSCSVARYAKGPETAEIESLAGYDGIIRTVTYPASEPGLSVRRMTVYLPPSYDRDSTTRFPVMYLLHGARGNEITWVERGDAFRSLDSLRREGAAADFILVLPNMNHYYGDKDYRNGRAVNATRAFWTQNGEVERYFVQDVVFRMDSLFRTIPTREGRAIAGMSTGALQALFLSATYPDCFDAVGLFSPYARAHIASIGHLDIYGCRNRKLRRQFENPPSVYSIYIGTADFFYPHMRLYDSYLTRQGYPHTFYVYPGGHEWYNWKAFLIRFYGDIFREGR